MLVVDQSKIRLLEERLKDGSAVVNRVLLMMRHDRSYLHVFARGADDHNVVVPLYSRFTSDYLTAFRDAVPRPLWLREFWESEMKMIMINITPPFIGDGVIAERVQTMLSLCRENDLICQCVDYALRNPYTFWRVFPIDDVDQLWFPETSVEFHRCYGAKFAKIDAFYIHKCEIPKECLTELTRSHFFAAGQQLLTRLPKFAHTDEYCEFRKACLHFIAVCPYTDVNVRFAVRAGKKEGEYYCVAESDPAQFDESLFKQLPLSVTKELCKSERFVLKFVNLLAAANVCGDAILNMFMYCGNIDWVYGLPPRFLVDNFKFMMMSAPWLRRRKSFFDLVAKKTAEEQNMDLLLFDRRVLPVDDLVLEHFTTDTVIKRRLLEWRFVDERLALKFAQQYVQHFGVHKMTKFRRHLKSPNDHIASGLTKTFREMYTMEQAMMGCPKSRVFYTHECSLDSAAYLRLLRKHRSVPYVTAGTDIVQFTHDHGLSATEVLDVVFANDVGSDREWDAICAVKERMRRCNTKYVRSVHLCVVPRDVRQNSLGFWCFALAHTQENLYHYVPNWFRCELLRRIFLNSPASADTTIRAHVSKSGAALPLGGFKWVQHAERLIKCTNVDVAKLVLSYVYECDLTAA